MGTFDDFMIEETVKRGAEIEQLRERSAREHKVIEAAKDWAAYQQQDSMLDQLSDFRLRANAEAARLKLVELVEALG